MTLSAFYTSLKRYGFQDAHITDLVKERKLVGPLTAAELDRSWPFFDKELSIVEPLVVVALGNGVLEPLVRRIDRIVPFWRVTHYAYRFRKGSRIGAEFDEDLKRLNLALWNSGLGDAIEAL